MTNAELLDLLYKLDLINLPYHDQFAWGWGISTVPVYNCSDTVYLKDHPELMAAFEEAGFLK